MWGRGLEEEERGQRDQPHLSHSDFRELLAHFLKQTPQIRQTGAPGISPKPLLEFVDKGRRQSSSD